MSNLEKLKKKFISRQAEEMSLEEYLTKAKKDPSMYASVYDRLLKAIGTPQIIDTSKDERLGRIFENQLIKRYEAFADFYGMEQVIERIVKFITFASQGLEEKNQILYLKGPPGSAKSSLAARLKELMEKEPIYVLTDSPMNESPLCLFTKADAKDLGIPERHLGIKPSPTILKRLEEYGGDITQFRVRKIYPSEAKQQAIGVVVPGDENTQDVSVMVGKINVRALEFFTANDPDCYSYSGGLAYGHRGIVEMIEMYKCNIKLLNPLLTATQEHQYQGTEAIGIIPFEGMVLAHSNETEWSLFRNNKANEALLDRTYIVDVPYCLRVDEEVEIYEKLIKNSELVEAPIAPGTLQMLAAFTVASRLAVPTNSHLITKLHVYNGEHRKDKDPRAKAYREYKKEAPLDEGFSGISTRAAFKIISNVFNFDSEEIAANPVHLMQVIEREVPELFSSDDKRVEMLDFLKSELSASYMDLISNDIQIALLDSYHEYGQSLFDRYVLFADQWVQDRDYRDPETGQLLNKKALEQELQKIEKPAEIASPKEFRQEVVNFCIRYQSKHNGLNPDWESWEKIKDVIQKVMFGKTQDLIPMISFAGHGTEEDQEKHKNFIERMKEKGYTEKQVRLLYDWQLRYTLEE